MAISKIKRGSAEFAILSVLAEERLYGFRSKSYWKAIDTMKDLTEASEQLEALAR